MSLVSIRSKIHHLSRWWMVHNFRLFFTAMWWYCTVLLKIGLLRLWCWGRWWCYINTLQQYMDVLVIWLVCLKHEWHTFPCLYYFARLRCVNILTYSKLDRKYVGQTIVSTTSKILLIHNGMNEEFFWRCNNVRNKWQAGPYLSSVEQTVVLLVVQCW